MRIKKAGLQRERGEENAQPFFTSLLIYTNVIKKGSQSSLVKLIMSDFYFNREFLGESFYSTVSVSQNCNEILRKISAFERLLCMPAFRE